MDAEIAIGRIHQALEIAKSQRFIRGERADNAEAQAFMDQSIQIGSGTLCLAWNISQARRGATLLSLI